MLKGLDAAELISLPAPEPGYPLMYAREDARLAALRLELQGLKVSVLQRRAAAAGVDDGRVDAAVDRDNPKDALIALIIECHDEGAPAADRAGDGSAPCTAADDIAAALRRNLQGLRFKEVRGRARDAGVHDDVVADCMDSDEPKRAVIDAIVALMQVERDRARA